MRTSAVCVLLSLGCLAVMGMPSNSNSESNVQTPMQDRSFGSMFMGKEKKKEPSFEINPNFGFRSYHQIRYEPMSVPFDYEQPPQQIPPVDFGYAVDAPYENQGYENGNDYRVAQPANNYGPSEYQAPVTVNNYGASDYSAPLSYGAGNDYLVLPNEFSSRQSSYPASPLRFY